MPTLEWIGKQKIVTHDRDVPFCFLDKKYDFNPLDAFDDVRINPKCKENMIIHGDNLYALKSLIPRYEGKVDCIYIDPPYNTGSENWIYNDNVNDPQIQKWLGEVVGKEDQDLSRHDKWLCMMYPRLVLLKRLLSPNGFIFISIDDNEHANLKEICDEIFNPTRFVGTITWEKRTKCQNTKTARRMFQSKTEYILMYKNTPKRVDYNLETESKIEYQESDEIGPFRYKKVEQMSSKGMRGRGTMIFPILGVNPDKDKQWKIGIETVNSYIDRGDMILDENGRPTMKVRPEDEDGDKLIPFWSHFFDKSVGTAESGKSDLKKILGEDPDFETVKPVNLIKKLLYHIPNNQNMLVLDSFGGSGTTAHAVLEMNAEDGGNRRFIMVEMMDYAESITARRVKNVINGYGDVPGIPGSFSFYELGEPLLVDGFLNDNVPIEVIREYVFYTETEKEYVKPNSSNPYYLGSYLKTGFYFIYEKDKISSLDLAFLESLESNDDESFVIYADVCNIESSYLKEHGIVFRKIPRDIGGL